MPTAPRERHIDPKGTHMMAVTVSERFEIVIPEDIREALAIRPGQRIEFLMHEGRAVLVPLPSIGSLRGFLEDIDTRVPREGDRT